MSPFSKLTSPCAGFSTTRATMGPFEEQSGFRAVTVPTVRPSPDGTKRVKVSGFGKAGVGAASCAMTAWSPRHNARTARILKILGILATPLRFLFKRRIQCEADDPPVAPDHITFPPNVIQSFSIKSLLQILALHNVAYMRMLPTTRERRVRQWSRTVSDCTAYLGRSTREPAHLWLDVKNRNPKRSALGPSPKFLCPPKSVWSLGYCRLAFLTLSSSPFDPQPTSLMLAS